MCYHQETGIKQVAKSVLRGTDSVKFCFNINYYYWTFFFFQDIGAGKGKYYAVNFPLRDGIDDDSYESIFKPVSLRNVTLCINI